MFSRDPNCPVEHDYHPLDKHTRRYLLPSREGGSELCGRRNIKDMTLLTAYEPSRRIRNGAVRAETQFVGWITNTRGYTKVPHSRVWKKD